MYKSNIYTKLVLLVSFLVLGFSSVQAQLEMKIQLMDDDTWGVYVTPDGTITPDSSTLTGSGQVTVVMPTGFSISNVTSVSGLWQANATIDGPAENPTMKYVSFGMILAEPNYPIYYQDGVETLLFTFNRVGACPDTLFLIDCNTPIQTDPFCPPNASNANVGNDLQVFQTSTFEYYNYTDNYAHSAWSCHDCDGDGILNALEDSNGNGVFDVGIDTSALCDPCDPYHVETAQLNLVDGFDAICAGDVIDTAYLTVDIEGGWHPYTVYLDNGTTIDTFTNYTSGDTIAVVPTVSSVYTLETVIDSFLCEIDPDSMFGSISIDVHGPISITADPTPDPNVECAEDGTMFNASAANAGDGTILYKWQVSTTGIGGTYIDIFDGLIYAGSNTDELTIEPVAGLHGNYYRMKIWTEVCDTVFSNGALLQVEGPISATTDPVDFVVCDDGTATFSGAGANAGAVGTLEYQWQINDGSGWVDVPSGTEPTGVTYSDDDTPDLSINNVDVGMDGWQVRLAIFTTTCNRVYTAAAEIDVEGPITVTNHPDDVSNCAGNEVFFITDYTNPGGGISTTFWQVNTGSGWVNISNGSGVYAGVTDTDTASVATDTLTITNVIGLDGNQYRLAITTGECTVTYSNGATLDVSGNVSFTQEPPFAPINVCAGADTIIVACATIPQGDFYFYWEYSTDGGATWDSLAIGASAIYDQSSNGATMSVGCDTLTINDATGLEYTWYRAVASASDCSDVTSTEARLIVEGPLSVNTNPTDTSICSGDPVQFTAAIDNAGDSTTIILYQWQYSPDNSVWVDIASGNYSGYNSNTLVILDVAGLHESYYRLSASTSDCGLVYTTEAQLFVEGPIEVTANPEDVTLCDGGSAVFTGDATPGASGTISYQWQVSSNGVNYTPINIGTDGGVYTGFNSNTLTVTDVTGLDNRSYRLAFTTGECSQVFTSAAELNIQGDLSITAHPVDATECSEDDVFFQVFVQDLSPDYAGDTTHIVYQWQENDGSGWVDLTNGLSVDGGDGVNGVTSSFLTVFETAGRDNNQFRVLISTTVCDADTSNAATLLLEGPLEFDSNPADVAECVGSGVSFTSSATNTGGVSPVQYVWQISSDNGVNWTNLADGGAYGISGATSTMINYTTVDNALDGNRIRLAAFTDYCDTIYSDYALFVVEGEIEVDTQPDPVTACSGDPVCFDIEASNGGSGTLIYRWQFSADDATWFDLSNTSTYNGVNTNTLCIADISGLDSLYYRCRISTANCAEEFSASALLVEEGPITFTDHPEDVTQCSAEAVTFDGMAAIQAGNSGTISYQWQESSDGLSYNPILAPGAAGYSGYTTTTLTVANVAGLNGWHYRLVATTAECSQVFSFSAVLTVEGPLSVALQPVDIQNCDDAEALFLSGISNPADPANLQTEYQWQILMPGGSWENLTNGDTWNGTNIIGGANSDTLLITPLTGLHGAYIRMKGWTQTCDTLTTDSALISVEGPLTFDDEPDNQTVCAGDPVTFTITADNATGVGTIEYQWQVSQLPNVWVDLTNSPPYSGVTTNQLSISNTSGLYNRRYRCKIRTGTCEWEFSPLAVLSVEGPITIDVDLPDTTTVCSNVGTILNTTISLPASSAGAMSYQWQVNDGSGWANLSDGQLTGTTNFYNGDETDEGTYFGVNSQDLSISLLEGLDGYQYRLLISTSQCDDETNVTTLNILDACSTGTCDFDLDGAINDLDDDDDNDLLTDVWEDYLTNNNVTDSWFYLTESSGLASPVGNAGSPNLIYYSNCDTDSDNDLVPDNLEDPDGDEIINGEETDGDGVFDGDPLDPCDPVLGPTCIGVTLAIDVYLQGGRIGNSGTYLRDDLRVLDSFPQVEPYSTIVDDLVPTNVDTPFVHYGDGGNEEVLGGSILLTTGQDAIIDWVFVELRSSTNLDSIITTRSAFLQADGDVVDIDGVSDLSFINAPAGPYYVVVRHRNHLGIMTAEALDLSPIVSEVDFTDTSTPTYGDYGQKEINGYTYLWGGDFNANGRTVYQGPYNDINYLFADIVEDQVNQGSTPVIANWIRLGYMRSDINLDGKCIYQGPGNDRAMMLFNTTLTHPLNSGIIANFVIEGILP